MVVSLGSSSGELLSPSTIGEPTNPENAHTNTIVSHTRVLLLCLAYFIGCVTAMNLQVQKITSELYAPLAFTWPGSGNWLLNSNQVLSPSSYLLVPDPHRSSPTNPSPNPPTNTQSTPTEFRYLLRCIYSSRISPEAKEQGTNIEHLRISYPITHITVCLRKFAFSVVLQTT